MSGGNDIMSGSFLSLVKGSIRAVSRFHWPTMVCPFDLNYLIFC